MKNDFVDPKIIHNHLAFWKIILLVTISMVSVPILTRVYEILIL